MNQPPYLFLPVETAARELDAKLVVAACAARLGFVSILGSHTLLNMQLHHFPRGIYLLQAFNRPKRRMAGIARSLGHRLMAWDEEGLVWLSPSVYASRRMDRPTLQKVDHVFAWGEEQAKVLKEYAPEVSVKITGNPRADLLSPTFRVLYAARARAIREKYGNFILINSNFGWLNYALLGKHGTEERKIAEIVRRSGHPKEYILYRKKIFDAFRRLIPDLSRRLPEYNIVIRPHPSEDPVHWQELAKPLGNVFVEYDDDLIAWLMASKALIHNGCTTAVEYALLGRFPLEFTPFRDERFDLAQPAMVSIPCHDVDEIISNMTAGDGAYEKDVNARLEMIVENVRSNDLAAERIVRHMHEHAITPKAPRLMGRARGVLRSIQKAFAARYPKSSSNPKYVNKKFPDYNAGFINDRLRGICKYMGIDPYSVCTKKLSERIYEIKKEG